MERSDEVLKEKNTKIKQQAKREQQPSKENKMETAEQRARQS